MSELTDPLRVRERVAHGAAALDAWEPRWFERVNPATLRTSDPDLCVIGQLTNGSYWTGVQAVTGGLGAIGHGFEGITEAEYAALDAEWRRVIAERRGE